jgi:O-antigen/teichoic acid export membrane protein
MIGKASMPLSVFVKKILASTLIRGSAVLMLGNLLVNLGNYIFNLLVGRFLGPVDYGVMAAVIALLYIISVPSTALNLIVTKFTSRFKAENEWDRLSFFFLRLNKILLFSCFLVLLLFVFLSRPLANFLKIDSGLPVIFLGGLLGATLLSALGNSTLQGLLKFNFLAVSGALAVAVKLVLGLGLVWWGWAVGGALTGFLGGFLLPYLISFWPLRFLFKEKKETVKIDWGEVAKFAAPAFFSTLGLTLLYTGDVVLVKHFFPAEEAGLYSALSLTARIILFVTAPIGMVMFPLISEKYTKKESYAGLFLTALLLTTFIAVAATVFYALFPELVVKIFFGVDYLAAAPYLGRFAIFLSLYSLCNLFASFYLAVQRVRIATLPFLFGVLQLVLIGFSHRSFADVLNVATGVTLALLICFVVSLTRVLKLDKPVRT